MRKTIFLYPVLLESESGNALHAKGLIKYLKKHESIVFYTYDTFKLKIKKFRSMIFLIRMYLEIISSTKSTEEFNIYARYTYGIGVLLRLVNLSRKKLKTCILEMNAVIEDEIQDKNSFANTILLGIAKLDFKLMKYSNLTMICVTPEIKKYYEEKGYNTVFIQNGVDIENFEDQDYPNVLISKKFEILFVGTLAPWQDLHTLLSSVKKLLSGSHDNVLLHIVGDGEMKSEIFTMINELNLKNHIIMHGKMPHKLIPNFIKKANLCVAPLRGSRNKNTGSSALKVYEYLLLGRPTIMTRSGEISVFLNKMNYVDLVDSEDVNSLTEKIILKYEEQKFDDQFVMKVNSKSIDYVKGLSWEVVANKTVDLLN